MKKRILVLVGAMLIGTGALTLVSCGGEEHHEEGAHEHVMYQCPMKCEGDKTYDKAGSCPVCGMDLKEVD